MILLKLCVRECFQWRGKDFKIFKKINLGKEWKQIKEYYMIVLLFKYKVEINFNKKLVIFQIILWENFRYFEIYICFFFSVVGLCYKLK